MFSELRWAKHHHICVKTFRLFPPYTLTPRAEATRITILSRLMSLVCLIALLFPLSKNGTPCQWILNALRWRVFLRRSSKLISLLRTSSILLRLLWNLFSLMVFLKSHFMYDLLLCLCWHICIRGIYEGPWCKQVLPTFSGYPRLIALQCWLLYVSFDRN